MIGIVHCHPHTTGKIIVQNMNILGQTMKEFALRVHMYNRLTDDYNIFIRLHYQKVRIIYRILHECSCLIEFIKQMGKSDEMRGLPGILSLFRNEFNKFNNS